MTVLLQVAIGGAIGAAARYGLVQSIGVWTGSAFPFGTLAVNVVGSLAMGCVAGLILLRPDGSLQMYAPFLMTGVLGGFTTFSAFSLDVVRLVERGALGSAFLYVSASVVLSIGFLLVGLRLARSLAG